MTAPGSVVWINGGFGSGKTTLAAELKRQRPQAAVFDPEYIGFALRDVVPVPSGDFQDLPSWRDVVTATVLSLHRHRTELLLVPMTLVNDDYFTEIIEPIRAVSRNFLHVFLETPAAVLTQRLQQRAASEHPDFQPGDEYFGIAKIDECVAAAKRQSDDTLLLRSDLLSPAQLASAVLERIAAGV